MFSETLASAERAPKTAIILCEHLGEGLNLDDIRAWIEATLPGIALEVESDLCRHPARLSATEASRGAGRLVLGLCHTEFPQVELQTQVRKMGLDPFGVETVPLGTLCAGVHVKVEATQKACVLLAAAVARAWAFQGSGPEHAKLYALPLKEKVSRRSLFTMPPFGYRPVPSIREGTCVARDGCQICAGACPRRALSKTNGHISLDRTRCDGCGVCLAACPIEAIDFPCWSIPQLEAELGALLELTASHGESTGILLTCNNALPKLEEVARQNTPYSSRWLPMTVPCLGMVTPTWVFQALAGGADAVALLTCGTDCRHGQQPVIGGRIDFCRRLLQLLGLPPDQVRLLDTSDPAQLARWLQEAPLGEANGQRRRLQKRLRLGTTEAASEAILHLAMASGPSPTATLEHPHSPFGIVEHSVVGCTGCLTCIEACPTGALAKEHAEDSVSMTFTASLCSGCGMCEDACPETAAGVLRVRKITDTAALSRDRSVGHKHELATCKGCGVGIASQALLNRIDELVNEQDDAYRTMLTSYCPSCRLPFAWENNPHAIASEEGVRSW